MTISSSFPHALTRSISAVLASKAYRCKLILQGLKQRNETSRMWMRTNNLALSSSYLLIRELGLRFQSTFPHELPCILGLTGCGDNLYLVHVIFILFLFVKSS